MGHGLLIATVDRAGGHAALLGVVVLVGAVVGLVYLVRSRRRPDASLDAGDQSADASDPSRGADDRSREPSDRSPTA